ncbi:MAG: tRNA (cytidine(34)-2'-O)-methyltransferase [Desulfobacterales bacterium]|nr:tRNA (cytidine(34)-2'-O)-methyltransferase [Desulfobacterales bacterium]MDX2513500.1 tRNA (cytidine(34)-2'-O)-methyltransferase [Desulfobacterales bacterium]
MIAPSPQNPADHHLDPLFDCRRHVVLVSPDIHWNTGNIGRTCLGTGSTLHLIKPLGFSLDSRWVKRAGLDYWQHVDLKIWNDFKTFLKIAAPEKDEVFLFSKKGTKPFWSLPVMKRMFLVFGSETKGLPPSILDTYSNAVYSIPITRHIRSLNLSSAVGIVLFETLRSCWSGHLEH